MNLVDLIGQRPEPQPWHGDAELPWFDPGFSARVLHDHLSQAHDTASRRTFIIKRHVAWIHRQLLNGEPSTILDLACGPGLYALRLAELGHRCVGIDFSPAAIDYAQDQARQTGLACDYRCADIRDAELGAGYDLALFIFGEFNSLSPDSAASVVRKAAAALRPGGVFLLEAHSHAAVVTIGREPRLWTVETSGPFSERPYICLRESAWSTAANAAARRYSIVDAATASVTEYVQSLQAYTRERYEELLHQSGFPEVTFDDSFGDPSDEFYPQMQVIVARRP